MNDRKFSKMLFKCNHQRCLILYQEKSRNEVKIEMRCKVKRINGKNFKKVDEAGWKEKETNVWKAENYVYEEKNVYERKRWRKINLNLKQDRKIEMSSVITEGNIGATNK